MLVSRKNREGMTGIEIIDLVGTFVFALSGVMAAVEKKFDFFGTIILAFVTAVGGGTFRDILIGETPVGWMSSNWHIAMILLPIPVAYFLSKPLGKIRRALFLFDTIGIALFTILGVQKSLGIGLSPAVAVLMGVVSAVFGGVIRDVLSNQVPLIFQREVYAFACLSGALLYIGLEQFSEFHLVNMFISMGLIMLVRSLAVIFKWSIPFRPIN